MTTPDNTAISPAGARWLARPTTDVGAATAAPAWCLPGAEPTWDQLTEEYSGGSVSTWVRTFPAGDVSADVWISCDDRIVEGRVLRTHPRICIHDREMTRAQARQLAAELLNAADTLDDSDQL